MDGGGTTTQSFFASSQEQLEGTFDLFQHHRVQQEDHFGTIN